MPVSVQIPSELTSTVLEVVQELQPVVPATVIDVVVTKSREPNSPDSGVKSLSILLNRVRETIRALLDRGSLEMTVDYKLQTVGNGSGNVRLAEPEKDLLVFSINLASPVTKEQAKELLEPHFRDTLCRVVFDELLLLPADQESTYHEIEIRASSNRLIPEYWHELITKIPEVKSVKLTLRYEDGVPVVVEPESLFLDPKENPERISVQEQLQRLREEVEANWVTKANMRDIARAQLGSLRGDVLTIIEGVIAEPTQRRAVKDLVNSAFARRQKFYNDFSSVVHEDSVTEIEKPKIRTAGSKLNGTYL